jgi:hypothetical protein
MPPNRIDFIARQDGIGLVLHVFEYGDVVPNPTPSTGTFVFSISISRRPRVIATISSGYRNG